MVPGRRSAVVPISESVQRLFSDVQVYTDTPNPVYRSKIALGQSIITKIRNPGQDLESLMCPNRRTYPRRQCFEVRNLPHHLNSSCLPLRLISLLSHVEVHPVRR
jgi:hypothetical protein